MAKKTTKLRPWTKEDVRMMKALARENARYAASLGHTDEGATVQAVIGIGVDILALVLLSVGWALWSRGHPALAVIARFVWPVMVGFSLMGIAGFLPTNLSGRHAKRPE